MDRHAQGIVLITLSAVAYSSAGFFTRLIHLDAWTMLFWRGLFAGVMILCVIIVQERGNTLAAFRAIGRPGLAAALCSTAATILYLNAFQRSSVADVAVLFAAAPFVTAGLGWLCLGVTEAWATLVASLVALLGVVIMVGGAAVEGHLVGDLLAFGMTVCMAVMMLIIRHPRETSMIPAACLSAFLCPLVVWPFASPLKSPPETWPIFSCSARRSSASVWCFSPWAAGWFPPPRTRCSTRWKRRSPLRGCGCASMKYRQSPAWSAASS